MRDDRPQRNVNTYLGARASIGPIPQELFFPWLVISLITVSLTQVFFQMSWVWTGILTVWGCGTWTILVGRRPYLFLGKFIPVPYKWTRGYARYLSFEDYFAELVAKRSQSKKKSRKRSRVLK